MHQRLHNRIQTVAVVFFFLILNLNFQDSTLTLGWNTRLPWSYGRVLEVCCHKRETVHTTWWTGPHQEPTCHWVCLDMAALEAENKIWHYKWLHWCWQRPKFNELGCVIKISLEPPNRSTCSSRQPLKWLIRWVNKENDCYFCTQRDRQRAAN